MPSVLPLRSMPSVDCQRLPAFSRAFSMPILRASSMIRPMVSSAVGLPRDSVPHTGMPRAAAAATSMAALRMPLVTISLSAGRALMTSAPNGVRSRIRQTTAQSLSAAITWSRPPRPSVKTLKLTSLAMPDQSATFIATD